MDLLLLYNPGQTDGQRSRRISSTTSNSRSSEGLPPSAEGDILREHQYSLQSQSITSTLTPWNHNKTPNTPAQPIYIPHLEQPLTASPRP